ncbi:uncharacterized protein LOC117808450 [Xyrichtys novacula]|nr:uncharacterized protein LOC117808450 [Xyrichtys novacula]
MAEEGRVYELGGLEKQLQSLFGRYSNDELRADSKTFCSDFCKLVEEYASCWQVPLPRLRILEICLIYFARGASFFAPNCEHVLHTLSSLALSVFELLLFFDQKAFQEEPLKHFTVTFQECHSAFASHQNVHLLQVERLVRGGGPWASSVLQAILSESSLPQNEVDGYISSELPVFFELQVRYLLSCEQRVGEAVALAKCCSRHPATGQHLFFLQVYLTWLLKTSQHDRLHREVADFSGKDAIHIICSLESEEQDELLLALCRAFLSQQLRRGDMYYLCDLVLVWSKLHSRLKTSKQALLEESHQLMLSATNVNSIFPFIRAVLQELGEDGVQFCVELCASALESCLPCDVITKSLIYKTIAGLLPNDLEVCRACALLVFFLERSVETYKMVYLLYMHPDQEYHVDSSPIRNHIRFETLQVLKKDLYFDPEFWNLIALRTNCLKLMSEKVVSTALEEIMEDKWILKYCTKDSSFRSSRAVCKKGKKEELQTSCKKRHLKGDTNAASKRLKMGSGRTRLHSDHTVKKRGSQGSRPLRDKPLRRSFWQLDKMQDSADLRRTTRLSEKNPPKRRIRTPRWLLEDSGTLEENNAPSKMKRHGLRHEKHHQSAVIKRTETGPIKNNEKHKPSIHSHLTARENNSKLQKGLSLDFDKPANPPQVILELSLPDNELMGTFNEETCNRQRGFPQVLLYKPTVKLPDSQQPAKTLHGKEVVIRARDAAMFIQQIHCYARKQKGKGNGSNVQGSVSTITRSSAQGSPLKDTQRKLSERPAAGVVTRTKVKETAEKAPRAQTAKAVLRKTSSGREISGKPAVEKKDSDVSRTSAESEVTGAPLLDKFLQGKAVTSTRELCEGSAVEMKVTIASQTRTTAKDSQLQGLDPICKAQKVKETPETATSAEVSRTLTADKNEMKVTDERQKERAASRMLPQREDVLKNQGQELTSPSSQVETDKNLAKADTSEIPTNLSNGIPDRDVPDISLKPSKEPNPGGLVMTQNRTKAPSKPTDRNSMSDISSLTLVTEMVTELAPETIATDLENEKLSAPQTSASKESKTGGKPRTLHKSLTTSSCFMQDPNVQGNKEGIKDMDEEMTEDSDAVETEESRLEFCCTFCHKEFKGSRVVAHAMFHYRKDECMFCGVTFKDDLLAMMHLSDHIEKLKRIKDTPVRNAKDNRRSESKDTSTPKSSSKATTTNVSSGGRGRPRKSDICLRSVSVSVDSTPPGSRRLRSNDKQEENPTLQDEKLKTAPVTSKTPVHKVNGHIGTKKKLGRPRKVSLNSVTEETPKRQKISHERTAKGAGTQRLQEKQESATSSKVDKEFKRSVEAKKEERVSLQVQRKAAKQDKAVSGNNSEQQEKVGCPVEGCAWFTDLSKNRVSLLYHALEDHYGDIKPLEVAYRVGDGKCSCCMRVLWSFEHFQHHVERHRLTPRYPCPHQGCPVRFKTGIEMRRHARKHSPLQAACCLPGCSKLFICLWALNLHEREHYSTKLDTKEPTGEEDDHVQVGKKQPHHEPKDATPTSTRKQTVSVKAAHKLKRQNTDKFLKRKHFRASLRASVRVSLLKQEVKEDPETQENPSNSDTTEHRSGPRLRQTLRKATDAASLKGHKVLSSSLFQHNIKARYKAKNAQVKVNTRGLKRRGRPPKPRTAAPDENTTPSLNHKTVKEKTAVMRNQKNTDQLTRHVKTEEASGQSRGQSPEDVKTTERSKLKSTRSVRSQMKRNHFQQKKIHSKTRLNRATSAKKTQKLMIDKMKKQLKARKHRTANKDGSQTLSSESTETQKTKNEDDKAATEISEKGLPLKEPEPVVEESESIVRQDEAESVTESPAKEEEKSNSEEAESTQNIPDDSVFVVQAESLTDSKEAPISPAEKEKTVEAGKRKKLEKGEKTTATSNSGKTLKKHKDANKEEKGNKSSKVSTLKKTSKSKPAETPVEAQVAGEGPLDVEAKEEASNVNIDEHDSSVSASAAANSSNKPTSPPAANEEKTQTVTNETKSNKSKMKRNVDPNKPKKECKDTVKKIVKKKCKDPRDPSRSKKPKKSKVRPEVKVEGTESSEHQEKPSTQTPQSTSPRRRYSALTNGQERQEEAKITEFKQNLAEYGKKPYTRAPPEVYLDEKYITMPKRRKEPLQAPYRYPSLEQVKMLVAAQKQRCTNCFATFNNAEELQGHLQLKNCSNLFGFDSDDEGNS